MTCPRCAQIDLLREQLAVLREIVGLTFPVPPLLHLAPMEATIFAALLKRECLTREAFETLLYDLRPDCDRPRTRSVHVHISNMRKKCRRFGIEIKSSGPGRGQNLYWMPPEAKQRAKELAQMQFAGSPLQ